jgi:hypothetical protein
MMPGAGKSQLDISYNSDFMQHKSGQSWLSEYYSVILKTGRFNFDGVLTGTL